MSDFMSEPLIEKHAVSTEVSIVNREEHKHKSHRVCRHDREQNVNTEFEKYKEQERKG